MNDDEVCCYCKKPGDLRPYGPDGAPLCFPCLKSSHEREKAAAAMFTLQLNAAGPVAVADKSGPYPAKHHHSAAVRALAEKLTPTDPSHG